ncbi:MAG: hypothetical protein J6R86_08610 [Lentisphaeria bacterium]|nr:hypothetical protein [Lentisphaeria bacterium]
MRQYTVFLLSKREIIPPEADKIFKLRLSAECPVTPIFLRLLYGHPAQNHLYIKAKNAAGVNIILFWQNKSGFIKKK